MLKPTRLPLLLAATVLASPAMAQQVDTLGEALEQTYLTNPTITGERAALRGDDAAVALAKAGGRPTLSAVAGIDRDLTRRGILASTASKGPDLSIGADLNVPLFAGGRVKNSVRAAQERVLAGRAGLRAVEGDIFVEAVTAYMDVRLTRDITELNENQVSVLDTNLQATSDRFEIGDVTRTDVAQSESRLNLAQASLAQAEGREASAEENFLRVVGEPAAPELAPPPPLPPLPETAEQAVQIALSENADLESIYASARASGYDTSAARAERLPTVSAVGRGTYINGLGNYPDAGPQTGTSTSVGLSSRIPIYQGGAPSARIRQAQSFEAQTLERRVAIERAVIAETRSAFATYVAANQAIAANEIAVDASALALEGARLENSIGSRTILDVLNAEQEFLNSQVNLATARRDAYVAGFRLLNAMGQAEAEDLAFDAALYDPLGNYRNVAGDFMDWSGEPDPEPVATTTRGVTDGGY